MSISQTMLNRLNAISPLETKLVIALQTELVSLATKVKDAASFSLLLGKALGSTVVYAVTLGNYSKDTWSTQLALAKEAFKNTDLPGIAVSIVVGSALTSFALSSYDIWNSIKPRPRNLNTFIPMVSALQTINQIATSEAEFKKNKVTPASYQKNRHEVAASLKWHAVGILVQSMAFYKLKEQYPLCSIPFYLTCANSVRNVLAMWQNYQTTNIRKKELTNSLFEVDQYLDRDGTYETFPMNLRGDN